MNKHSVYKKLHNYYFVMRHGQSQANVQKIILSNPKEGTSNYGLTSEGEEQARYNATKARKEKLLDEATIIFSSDFKRTMETAEIVKEVLKANRVILDKKLRERYFGHWEKTHKDNYQKVWDDDIFNPEHKNNDVESTQEVLTRVTSLIQELEKTYFNKTILLVSHGDTLQILQTAFERVSSGQHRAISHLQTAEIRKLVFKNSI